MKIVAGSEHQVNECKFIEFVLIVLRYIKIRYHSQNMKSALFNL